MHEVIDITKGCRADYEIDLFDADGNPVTGYTDDHVLSAYLYAGDDQTIIATPDVSWVDSANGKILLTCSASLSSTLSVSRYQGAVRAVDPDDTDNPIEVWRGSVDVQAAPGSATSKPVYTTYDDLRKFYPNLDQLQTDVDQSGFREQQEWAREWLDNLIAKKALRGGQFRGTIDAANWGTYPNSRSKFVLDQLAANKLTVTSTTKAICAHYALSMILISQIGPNKGPSNYQQLASYHKREAADLTLSYAAEIDLNGSGYASIVIPCGLTTFRGG